MKHLRALPCLDEVQTTVPALIINLHANPVVSFEANGRHCRVRVNLASVCVWCFRCARIKTARAPNTEAHFSMVTVQFVVWLNLMYVLVKCSVSNVNQSMCVHAFVVVLRGFQQLIYIK